MKRVTEMEEEELLALTDEQVAIMIDYECALEGAPMLPPAPGPKPERDVPSPDAQVYIIGGFNTLDAEHAARILTACESGKLYGESYASGDYSVKYLENLDSYHAPKIESRKVYSSEQWDKISGHYAKYTEQLSLWGKKDKAYGDALKARLNINDSVWSTIYEARDKAYNREQLRAEFARYLVLAEGNRSIATGFLKKVKGTELSSFPELIEEFNPPIESVEQSTNRP